MFVHIFLHRLHTFDLLLYMYVLYVFFQLKLLTNTEAAVGSLLFLCVCIRFKMLFPLPAVIQQDPSYYWVATMALSTT